MVKSKKTLISATILVLALILMAGTFAWQQAAHKINEFIGHKTGITGRDDFNPKTGVKDIYVENNGTIEVFVRIRLNERMDLTQNDVNKVTDPWKAHKYGISAADCGQTNAAGYKFHDYFQWTMGGWKWYMPSDGSEAIVQDNNIYNGSESGVKQTPNINPTTQIIPAATYLAMSENAKKAFIGWIYDTDGYAYWSQPLKQGDVTGLLLHQVTTKSSLKGTEYYYAIDAIFEAVDVDDIPMWTQGLESVDGSGKKFDQAATPDIINNIKLFATPVILPPELDYCDCCSNCDEATCVCADCTCCADPIADPCDCCLECDDTCECAECECCMVDGGDSGEEPDVADDPGSESDATEEPDDAENIETDGLDVENEPDNAAEPAADEFDGGDIAEEP